MNLTVSEIDRQVRVLEQAIRELRAKVDQLLAEAPTAGDNGRRPRLSDLKGIWQGVDLSLEDIQGAEYGAPEDEP